MSEISEVGQEDADAIAAAESEGMPPQSALPLITATTSGHNQRRWGLARSIGRVAALLAVLGIVGVGSVLLVRQRRR